MPLSWNLGTLTSWNPLGHPGPVTGLLYLLYCVDDFGLTLALRMRKYVPLHYTSFRFLPKLFNFFFRPHLVQKSNPVWSNKMCVDFIYLGFRFSTHAHYTFSLIKNTVLCDMMPYNLVEICQSIRDTCLHLQGKSFISLLHTRWKNLSEIWDPHDSDDEEYWILRQCSGVVWYKLMCVIFCAKECFALLPESGWRRLLRTAGKFLPNSTVSHKTTVFFVVTDLRT